MRFRSAFTAVLGAALLLAVNPAPASAATGQFRYDYVTDEGYDVTGFINDPPNEQCLTLPGVDRENTQPGHSPKNRTNAWATVFSEPGCQGKFFKLRPHTGGASERLKVRSVVFD